jgi:hypothetical protein
MSETERTPAEVFSLAEHLGDEMAARGWTTTDVATRMGGSAEAVAINILVIDLLMCVQDEKLLVSDDLFAGLAKAFRVTEQYFRNLHEGWLKHPDRRVEYDPPESLFGPISRRSMFHVVKG